MEINCLAFYRPQGICVPVCAPARIWMETSGKEDMRKVLDSLHNLQKKITGIHSMFVGDVRNSTCDTVNIIVLLYLVNIVVFYYVIKHSEV